MQLLLQLVLPVKLAPLLLSLALRLTELPRLQVLVHAFAALALLRCLQHCATPTYATSRDAKAPRPWTGWAQPAFAVWADY